MNSDPRYEPVDQSLPAELPPITSIEAARAALALVEHFGRRSLAGGHCVELSNMVPTRRARRCWISLKTTSGHYKGWGRLIHDVSHMVFRYRHPTFRHHDGGHAALEREIAEYVVSKGWLAGKLRPPQPKKISLQEQRAARLNSVDARIVRWQSKLRRAQNSLQRLVRQRRDLVKKLSG